jgi:uncharacterized protein
MNVRIVIFVILVFTFILAGKIYYDTYTIDVRHYRIANNRLAGALAGTKLAFVSDLHAKRYGPLLQEVLSILQQEDPDYILLGGDYISFQGSYEPVMAFYNQLKNAYAVMGNSDYYNENGSCILCHQEKSQKLKAQPNVVFLRNSAFSLNKGHEQVNLIGLDEPVNKRSDMTEAMRRIDPSGPSILLAHSPDVFEEASYKGIDFVLSGHNHGGQVFPARYLKGQMLVDPSYQYLDGFFQKGRTLMYVGRGVGTSFLPFRFGVRPEVAFFQFVHETGDATNSSQGVTPINEQRRSAAFSMANLVDLMGVSNGLSGSGKKKHIIGPSGKLFDFESEEELEYLNWECHKWFELSHDHVTSGQYSLEVTLPAGQYPGINFIEIENDWSAYRQFKMDVFNPVADPLTFHVRIDDKKSGWDYGDRYDRDFTLKRGLNQISIPLDSIKANIAHRSLDLKNIKRLMFFIPGNDKKRSFHIDNIRLE